MAIWGEKLYQERARQAFPILVRQAEAGNPIFYSDLAAELQMPNPRNLNYVLGSIGQTIRELAETSGIQIPPIQCLVINLTDRLPGEGVGWFLERGGNSGYTFDDYSQLTRSEQRDVVERELERIYSFVRWRHVLDLAGLNPCPPVNALMEKPTYGGGEGPQHQALKKHIAGDPSIVGVSARSIRTIEEHRLLSGDVIDVLIETETEYVAVEVKSEISDAQDIQRGLFQCVKYNAVLRAQNSLTASTKDVRCVLALGGPFPSELRVIKNCLGTQFFENLTKT